ncbi:MAG: hypothetical protein ACK55X_12150 [Synechococcaceae cyanobacterium]
MAAPVASDGASGMDRPTGRDTARGAPRALPRRPRLAYAAAALGAAALSLLLLETLLDRRLEQSRLRQLGSEVAGRLLLGEVALERFSPAALAELGGMRLAVGPEPEPRPQLGSQTSRQRPADRRLRRQAKRLRSEICRRLPRCPVVWPSRSGPRGVWVEMEPALALERVWLFVPLAPRHAWPPDPLLLGLGLAAGSLAGVLLYLTL